ncbi:RNA-directed DNA polymerase, eukaryota [Tanacetum coccineum]
MAVFDLNQPASSLSEEDDVAASNSHAVSVSSSINTGCDSFASHDDNASYSNILKTPKAAIHHEFIDTPGGSVYWVPRVSASVLQVLGTVYDSLDECIEMYRKYASKSVFGIRLSCQKRLKCGCVKQKYIVCNREGCPKDVWLNTLDPKKNDRQVRSSNFRVCGCKARVLFDMVPHTTKYTLTTFDVEHNHELNRVEYKHLSKAERKLTYNGQLFIIKAANANIGAVRAHNLYTDLKGSSSLVHGTQTEFKNFTRCVNYFIGDSDAQMLITRMEKRQKFTKDFNFDYFIEDAELCGLFWADKVTKCNYKEFGDIVSFDATYKTNKYKMVFVPFMAINNHRRTVTVGSGLLKKETAEAYGWLLRAFKKAFVHAPNIVVTDQDGAMRLAVVAEFPESKHRLCMWHIMQKIPAKNMFIGPLEFKDRWNKLMEEFNLVNHKWLSKLYRLRSSWIPAFFVDSPLCGLMRSTSRQRHTQEKLDHQSFDSFPAMLTPLPIEEHAAKVYTHKGFTVCIIDEEKIKPVGLPEVIDKESTSENVEEEINLHQKVTGHYKLFVRFGILCRHIFYVFKNFKVSCIPDQYILRRWTKDLILPDLRNPKNRYDEKNEAIEKLIMEASIILDSCVHMLRNNEPKLYVFVNKMKAIKSGLEAELPIVPTHTVSDFVQEFIGVKKPDNVKVKNPIGKNNVDVLYPVVVVSGGSDNVDGGLRDGACGSVSVHKQINNNPYTSFGFVMSLNDYRGLDVPTAKLFLIPTGKLMVPAGSSWFLLVVPAGRLCGSCWSAYGSDSLISVEIRWRLRYGRFMGRSWILQLDSCVHMLRNNEPKLSVFVNKMKAIKSELEAELPIVPNRIVSDFVQEFMGVYKPDKVKVKNPTGVRLKEHEKQKRIKSGREISMKKIVVPGGSDHVDGGLRDGASGSVSV